MFGLTAGIALNSLQGIGQLALSMSGFVIGIAVLFVPFAFGWMGAGDVKFFGVLGAILGMNILPRVFFYSALVAGVIAVGYVSFGRFSPTFFRKSWAEFKVAVATMGGVMPESINTKVATGSHSVPWGVAFSAGAIVAYYFDPAGRWAGF